MNYQEALDSIANKCFSYLPSHIKSIDEAKDKLQELVDKNTPMEPINIKYNTHGGVMWGDCPKCGTLMVGSTGCSNNDCRQAIKWPLKQPEPKLEKLSNWDPKVKADCKDDLKKLYGIAPYDGSTNFVRGDNFFGAGIRKKYGIQLTAECERELGIWSTL